MPLTYLIMVVVEETRPIQEKLALDMSRSLSATLKRMPHLMTMIKTSGLISSTALTKNSSKLQYLKLVFERKSGSQAVNRSILIGKMILLAAVDIKTSLKWLLHSSLITPIMFIA